MLRYHLDAAKLKDLVARRGYAHLTGFARAHGFNRATLNNYINGKGGPLAEGYLTICDALQADPVSLLVPSPTLPIPELTEIMPAVKEICAKERGLAVGLFGSRAKAKARKYSDWDLGLTKGQSVIAGVEFLRLKRTVEAEVDALPREVDFVNLDAAPGWFLRGIDYEPIFLGGDAHAWAYFLGVLHGAKKT